MFHVEFQEGLIRFPHVTQFPGRTAAPKLSRWDGFVRGDQRPRRNKSPLLHRRPVQDDGTDPHQAFIFQRTAMQPGAMADGHILADQGRTGIQGNMHHGPVLYVGAGADLNPLIIPAQDRTEPDTGFRADGHIADKDGARRDEGGRIDLRGFPLKRQDNRGGGHGMRCPSVGIGLYRCAEYEAPLPSDKAARPLTDAIRERPIMGDEKKRMGMDMNGQTTDRIDLAPGLSVSRALHGMWQIADMEKDGTLVDPDATAERLAAYAAQGFDSFDMADHYGSAELIAGAFRRNHEIGRSAALLTKWCPPPAFYSAEEIRAGVQNSFDRLDTDVIDLLQLHWWQYEHPGYLNCLDELTEMRAEGRIRALGLTNFNTDHLRILLSEGYPIATNQVCYSLLDRRAGGDLAKLCQAKGVRLLCYGTLAGGFLSERWLEAPEPQKLTDWSKLKYKRFIDTVGGWDAFQNLLRAVKRVADHHGVSISAVASRWVLQQPAVAAVIVGARFGENDHSADTQTLFGFSLNDVDRAVIEDALYNLTPLPGDCGDEYRKPPFLTASGDLSHHLDTLPPVFPATQDDQGRDRVDTGSEWEPIAGYSRAVRAGDRILVSGTTATHTDGRAVASMDAAAQTTYILDRIQASIQSLGGRMEDVIRTRIYLRNADDWEGVSRAHGRVFGDIRPANTLIEVSRLVGDYLVEIEAEAYAPVKS